MSPLRACVICGQPAPPSQSRCQLHELPRRSGSYSRAAAKVRAAAEYCWICGRPFTDPNDPPVADHVIPRAHGGSDSIGNLAPAHRSCNGRKGATLAGIWIGDGGR